ncbi:NAD(P)-binding protein [Gyrodon lividus]|nr:NAD(P)-binding protein [Gyrodon lividus]
MTTRKVAIITGASSGIGRHTAIALSVAGWSLTLTARRLAQLEETKVACANPESCLLVDGDITDEGFVKSLFEQTLKKFGRLDLLFNNAGISDKAHPIEEMPLELFTSVVNVNLVASFLCTREAFKVFKSHTPTGGRIINNGSLAAHVPRPHSAAYACSKHAVSGLTKSSAIEGRQFDISVTQIDIGNAHTTMAAGHTLGALQPDGRRVVEPTFDPVHVAQTVVHIAGLPNSVTVLDVNIMATGVPYAGRG